MAVFAEALGGGFRPDHGQSPTHTGERPGLKRLAIFIGPDTFVPHESKPEYFRRVTPQPVVERTPTTARPNQTPEAPGE